MKAACIPSAFQSLLASVRDQAAPRRGMLVLEAAQLHMVAGGSGDISVLSPRGGWAVPTAGGVVEFDSPRGGWGTSPKIGAELSPRGGW